MKRWVPPLSALALFCLGCASTQDADRLALETALVDPEIERVARELVRATELRSDPAPMRVVVLADSTVDVSAGWGRSLTPVEAGPLCDEIVDELELVLSPELNLLDADWSQDARPDDKDPLRVAEALGATHVLVAGLTPRARSLRLSLRLIETRSHLIVATSQGRLTPEIWTERLERRRAESEQARLAASTTVDQDPPAPITVDASEVADSADVQEPEIAASIDEAEAGEVQLEATAPIDPAPGVTVAQLQPAPGGEELGALASPEQAPVPTIAAPPGPAALRLRAMGRQLRKAQED